MSKKVLNLNENKNTTETSLNLTSNFSHLTSNHKGITLIALIITIIVMLILVAVTVTIAINGGLFGVAKEAKNDTEEAIDVEQTLGNGRIQINGVLYKSIDAYLNNKQFVELPEGIKVGDYVNYTPDEGVYIVANGKYGSGDSNDQYFITETEENGETPLEWRILSIDEETGKIELVSATVAQSSTKLYLDGVDGYNHGVDILNDLCRTLYSKEINGRKVAESRSLNVEDINSKTTYDYTKYTNDYNNKYGDEFKYSNYSTNDRKYPSIYAQEDGFYIGGEKQEGGISDSTGLNDGVVNDAGITEYKTVIGYIDDSEDNKNVSITFTYYFYKVEKNLKDNLGINTLPEGLINIGIGAKNNYWLASRCYGCASDLDPQWFGLRRIAAGGTVTCDSLYAPGR